MVEMDTVFLLSINYYCLFTIVTPARHSVTDNALTTVSGSLSIVTDNTVTNNMSTTLLKVTKHHFTQNQCLSGTDQNRTIFQFLQYTGC